MMVTARTARLREDGSRGERAVPVFRRVQLSFVQSMKDASSSGEPIGKVSFSTSRNA
jgi:hypothetical protein